MLKSEITPVLGLRTKGAFEGLHAAVVMTDGTRIAGFGPVGYRAYTEAERAVLVGTDDAARAEICETAHAALVAQFDGVALMGFDGPNADHAGSGAILALVTGLPVVWDFRSSDLALGGRGRPLAPFYHFALAQHIGATEPLVFLDLGRVSALSWVDPTKPAPEEAGALLAFEAGPCASADDAQGSPDMAVVQEFLREGYFLRVPPKLYDAATDSLAARVAHLSAADALATRSECAAAAIGAGLDHLPRSPARVLAYGPGRHNTNLMARIAAHLPCPLAAVDAAGLDGDALPAQAIAHLAMRVARGLATSGPGTTGVAASVGGGQISAP